MCPHTRAHVHVSVGLNDPSAGAEHAVCERERVCVRARAHTHARLVLVLVGTLYTWSCVGEECAVVHCAGCIAMALSCVSKCHEGGAWKYGGSTVGHGGRFA